MFMSAKSLTKFEIDSFNTKKVKDISNMFNLCTTATSLNIIFDTSEGTNMSSLFANCYSFKNFS